IEKQKEHLNLFDEKISYFYKNHKREFIISFFLYLFGWFASVIELYITLRFLNVPISVSEAIIIESLNTIGRSLMFFIPGQVGTQEGTLYLLFRLFPTITSTGNVLDIAMAYSIIRRIREFIWLGFGMIFLSKFNLKLPKLSIKKNKSIPFKSDFQENNPKKNQD
ncbi:MAG: flippase-like domain-containing protein, partial [Spirochaetota bacterium]|nr:flippase-like domain-containing protein [Spirochaetota bacterium]